MTDFIFTSKGAIYRLNEAGRWTWLEDIVPMLKGECNTYEGTQDGPYQALAGYPVGEHIVALEQWVERDRIEMRILWDVLKQNDDMEKQALVLVAALAPLD